MQAGEHRAEDALVLLDPVELREAEHREGLLEAEEVEELEVRAHGAEVHVGLVVDEDLFELWDNLRRESVDPRDTWERNDPKPRLAIPSFFSAGFCNNSFLFCSKRPSGIFSHRRIFSEVSRSSDKIL